MANGDQATQGQGTAETGKKKLRLNIRLAAFARSIRAWVGEISDFVAIFGVVATAGIAVLAIQIERHAANIQDQIQSDSVESRVFDRSVALLGAFHSSPTIIQLLTITDVAQMNASNAYVASGQKGNYQQLLARALVEEAKRSKLTISQLTTLTIDLMRQVRILAECTKQVDQNRKSRCDPDVVDSFAGRNISALFFGLRPVIYCRNYLNIGGELDSTLHLVKFHYTNRNRIVFDDRENGKKYLSTANEDQRKKVLILPPEVKENVCSVFVDFESAESASLN